LNEIDARGPLPPNKYYWIGAKLRWGKIIITRNALASLAPEEIQLEPDVLKRTSQILRGKKPITLLLMSNVLKEMKQ
jgi:hypothetical protein